MTWTGTTPFVWSWIERLGVIDTRGKGGRVRYSGESYFFGGEVRTLSGVFVNVRSNWLVINLVLDKTS